MITYNDSIFLANDSRQKVWTLERREFHQLKRKGKGIMMLKKQFSRW